MTKKTRKAKTNKYAHKNEPQATLDFHDFGILNENETTNIFEKFVQDCQNKNIQKILIITGKGLHSQNNTPVIKPLIERLLQKNPQIKSFTHARIDRGGKGAFEATLC